MTLSPSGRLVAFLVFMLLILSVEITVVHLPAFNQHPTGLSFAVVFDLVFITTGIFYWLVARPLNLAKSRLLLLGILMLRLALFIIPDIVFNSDKVWPALLILVEGVVLGVAIVRIRTITQTYRRLRTEIDSIAALQRSFSVVFGDKAANIIVSEGLIIYYALFGWQVKSDVPSQAVELTAHRQSGQITLTAALVIIGLIESVVVHLLLDHWLPSVSFWETALSLYGLLFLLADITATLKRPSYLTDTKLHLRLGIRWRAQIDYTAVSNVSFIHEKLPRQINYLNGTLLTAPNVLLTFHEPVCVEGPYGIRKVVRRLSFFIDDQASVVQAITAKMRQ